MSASRQHPVISMVAGETSGDMLAARLLSGLRPRLPDSLMHGIGGPRMAEYGFVNDWPMEKLSVRGLFEVLAHYREISGIRNQLRERLLAERPDVFIGVDAPDFNLGLETDLREAGIPTMHYISPSIWAWRGGRIKKIKKAVSHMLVVFPFEEAIYQQAGIPATYVGHPLAQVIPEQVDVQGARQELGLDPRFLVIAMLPGSRMSEIKYNTTAFIGAARLLMQREPNLQILVPMAGQKQREYFIRLLVENKLDDVPLIVTDGKSHTCIAAADAVMVASGTATLEVALYKKPMVIAYKMMEASWQILRHMGYQPWVGLPNILEQRFIVPELLQSAATPQALADALWNQLTDDANRAHLTERFSAMHASLLRDSANVTAEAVMKVIAQSR